MIRLRDQRAWTYDVPFVGEMKPYAHQVIQRRLIHKAMQENKQVIIWNQAMTGAGKTLANYSYLLEHPRQKALGVYPVNELVKDQYASIQNTLPLGHFDEVAVWTADELKQTRHEGESKVEQLARLMSPYHRLVLSNPDHLMLIAQERLYSYRQGSRVSLFYQLLNYNLQVFDEFHLYDINQINFLLQWMALMKAAAPNRPFVFLLSSATPRRDFFQLAERLQLEIWNVQEEAEKWLAEEAPNPVEERVFLEPLELEVKASALQFWKTSEKILADWGEVEAYLNQFPQAKGLIILDSIHEAQFLAQSLRDKGYEVGEVHGLSNRRQSRRELAKQITVATATVEVGVDFQGEIYKDFLLFEARNAGSFMQRLGRIGRGCRLNPDPPLRVWAYVPGYVVETIQSLEAEELSRGELQRVIVESYQKYQDFLPYLYKVGGMNLIHNHRLLERHQVEPETAEVLETIRTMAEQVYGDSFETQKKRYDEWRRQKLIEPVIHFRGTNAMESHLFRRRDGSTPDPDELETFYPDLWFWDELIPEMPLKKYDFNFVLRRRIIQLITKEEIMERIKARFTGAEREELLEELKRDCVLGYAEIKGIRQKPAQLYWRLSQSASRYKGQLVRLDSLRLESDDPFLREQLAQLFTFSNKKSWIVYLASQSVKEMYDQYRLPPMFRLYPAKVGFKDKEWSIAFNSEAFQLWSIDRQLRSEVL